MTDFRSTNLRSDRLFEAHAHAATAPQRRAFQEIDMMHELCLTEADRPGLQDLAALLPTPVVRRAPIQPWMALALGAQETAPIEVTAPDLDAIFAGVSAGEVALEHTRRSGALKLFVGHAQSSSAEPRLEALRAYAELRSVLLADDRKLPSASLSAAGFTDAQIVKFDAIIVAWSKG